MSYHHRVIFGRWLSTPLLVTLALAPTSALASPSAHSGPPVRSSAVAPSSFHAWQTTADFRSGQLAGGVQVTQVDGRPALTLEPRTQVGSWTSPVWKPSSTINDLVSSWQASTPGRSWIETQLSVQVAAHWSRWYVMGRWALTTAVIHRTSANDQKDADGKISTDTYVPASNGAPTGYRLRITLNGSPAAQPVVYQLAATTTSLSGAPSTTSTTTIRKTVDLAVPRYSQMIHAGELPAFGGGGEVWCSPTSTAMVVAYWHRGPSAQDLDSIGSDPAFEAHGRTDPQVDWAAMHTWDVGYHGTGNWPFNAAYASAYGLDGSIRQYSSLRDVEKWILQGVPVVASIAWNNTDASTTNDLTGAPIPNSGGHLVVITGFTAAGDIIVNDPAASTDATVQRTYQRAQFEHDWLNASTGTTYIIHTVGHPAP
jgi:Peptidase_C39 like family